VHPRPILQPGDKSLLDTIGEHIRQPLGLSAFLVADDDRVEAARPFFKFPWFCLLRPLGVFV
jgi:hypothetical protein